MVRFLKAAAVPLVLLTSLPAQAASYSLPFSLRGVSNPALLGGDKDRICRG